MSTANPLAFDMLTPTQAAEYLGVTVEDLARWRVSRNGAEPIGPRFFKPSSKVILYVRAELDRFVAERSRGGAK